MSIDQLEKYPNFSYEFIFKAYDCFSKHYHPSIEQITDKLKTFYDTEWNNILELHTLLKEAFEKLIAARPVKACQYLYIRLCYTTQVNKAYSRVTTDISGGTTVSSNKRKSFVDAIEAKYRADYSNYADTIRKASMLYRYLLKHDTIIIGANTYNITTEERLHVLVSGFLYTLRNDIMHGSSMAITKSSKTTLGTYAIDYFAYLLLYYLLVILIINKFSADYSSDIYDQLADNIEKNVDIYKQLFGREIEF